MNVTNRVVLHSRSGPTLCMVEIEIDTDQLTFELGAKALRNKSKRCAEAHGAVVVKVRPIKEAV